MNTQTKELIDRLVNAVNVDINYKDKMFFDTLEKNNILVFKDENKRNISFNDVKYAYESNDTPENKLMEQFTELENKYIDSKTIKGLQADEKFYAGFEALGIDIKEEIYEAFDNFTGEMLNIRSVFIDKLKEIEKLEKRIKRNERVLKKSEESLLIETDDEIEKLLKKKEKAKKIINEDEKTLESVRKNVSEEVPKYIPLNLVFKIRVKTGNCSGRHKQEDFQFPTLMILLDVLSKSMICHALKLYSDNKLVEAGLKGQSFNSAVGLFDEYYKLNMTNMPSKVGNVVVPMLVRKILALTCYILNDFGNYISIKSNRGPLIETTGVNANIMEEMFLITSDLGYPLFTKKGKMFVHDKWSIYPEKMFKEESYIPPLSPIPYAGIKQGWLGYVINKLQAQVPYKKFLDAFGGSGVSIVQFPHNNDSEYYINDFHYANICYYKIFKANDLIYNDFLDCVMDISNALETVINNYSGTDINKVTQGLYNIYDHVSDMCIDYKKKFDLFYGIIKDDFQIAMSTMLGQEYNCIYTTEVIIAAVFFAYGRMPVKGNISKYLKSGKDNNSTIRKLTDLSRRDIENLFTPIRKMYKDTDIPRNMGASAMELLADKEFNDERTLVYLDSPYLETAGYNANENTNTGNKVSQTLTVSDYGKKFISKDFAMDELLDAVDKFKGNYIFSCRLAVPSLKKYLYNYNKINPIPYNNYLWFFKRWSQMHNIDDIYMYCLYDEEWNSGEKKNPDNYYADDINREIYYDSRGTDAGARGRSVFYPVNASVKDEFLSNTWEPTDDDCNFSKEELYDYIKYLIFCGKNYEIFIVNKKLKTPNFYEMYEHIDNIYGKSNIVTNQKYRTRGKVNSKDSTELYIPNKGKFIRIPLSIICKIIDADINLDFKKREYKYNI